MRKQPIDARQRSLAVCLCGRRDEIRADHSDEKKCWHQS